MHACERADTSTRVDRQLCGVSSLPATFTWVLETKLMSSALQSSKGLCPLSHVSPGFLCPLCSCIPQGLSASPCQSVLSLVPLSHPSPRPHVFPGDNCPLGCSARLDLKGSFLWGLGHCQEVVKPGLSLGTRAGSSFLHQGLK